LLFFLYVRAGNAKGEHRMFALRSKFILGVGIAIGLGGLAAHAQPQRGRRAPEPLPRQNPVAATQQQAADAVQRAYEALRRSTVLSQTASGGTTDILAQGRDAYQQALSQYQVSNFIGARETAMAAADLAHAAEQITTANLLEASTRQTQLPAHRPAAPPPSKRRWHIRTSHGSANTARVSPLICRESLRQLQPRRFDRCS
jgi:hypothetical protein